jgi:HEAT repeats
MSAAHRPAELSPAARTARVALYLLLLGAAAAALLVSPGVDPAAAPGRRPELLLAPVLLGAFAVGFTAYRFRLVHAGQYHAGKAFVQVGLLGLVLVLFVPGSVERWKASGAVTPVDLTRQLRSEDPEARAMAAELVRHRAPDDGRRYVPRLVALLEDPSPEVRRQASASLQAMAGQDVGGEGAGAAGRWRAFWAARGVAFPP